ncbi:MAG: D-alanyl-D-alanine carboxypeptidase family protein [Oscillospiraceae bacterium]
MKKLLSLALTLLLLLSLALPVFALDTVPESAISLSSPCAVLLEKSTGDVIYEKNSRQRGAPASVTKVMTLLLIAEAVDGGLIAMDDMVTGSAKASSMGGSQVWLKEGEQLSVSDMIKCIAVVSANDCAVAMAEHIAGSEEAFVQKMNDRAAALGLEDTHFTNCTGLFDDPAHYTCAYDLAVMSRELILHDWIKTYTTIWMDSIRDGKSGLTNTNKLVRFYEGCTGLKTGFTSNAMYCLSATALRDGVEYIAVVMHGESIEKRNEDAKALLSYGFANYALCPLRSGGALPPVAVELGAASCVQPVYEGAESLLLPKASARDISYSLDLCEGVAAPVAAGDVLGKLSVSSGGSLIAEVNLVAGAEVPRLGLLGIFSRLLSLLVSSS